MVELSQQNSRSMNTRGRTGSRLREPIAVARVNRRGKRRPDALTGGGPDGNEQLTSVTGLFLIGLLAVIGVTILRIGQLMSVHLFVGFLLIGPVALKMGSTGYRFVRYYAHNRAYHEKGPPHPVLRSIAPIVVTMTVLVFASGVVLMFKGPADRGQWVLIHKVSFIVWIAFTALHVLGHLPGLPAALRAVPRHSGPGGVTPGGAGRWIALAGAIVGGLVLAIVLIPDFASWTAHGALHHHREG
jgi:hypothetical protein